MGFQNKVKETGAERAWGEVEGYEVREARGSPIVTSWVVGRTRSYILSEMGNP